MSVTGQPEQAGPPEQEQADLALEQLKAKHPRLHIWPAHVGREIYADLRYEIEWPLVAKTPAELDQKIEAAAEVMRHSWPHSPRGDAGPAGGP